VQSRKRAAVLVLGPHFSRQVSRCSFLDEGVNPFNENGINLAMVDAELLRDESQATAASIIEQVAQVTLLRVILPWMIGKAFAKIGDEDFMDRLGGRVHVPLGEMTVPVVGKVNLGRKRLSELLTTSEQKQAVGAGVQRALQEQFSKYNLTGKTWHDLTQPSPARRLAKPVAFLAVAPQAGFPANLPWAGLAPEEAPNHGVITAEELGLPVPSAPAGSGLINRGALRYQSLVPSYTVMFAFFLVLNVGWLFVAERRQGTLKRLRAAPLSDGQILLGKLVPCLVLSIGQGFFLLAAGKVVFDMSWGARPGWLVPVVLATSMAATGMALLVACLARTEAQVAVYGTLLVLVLAGISGCLMGDPELMPEQMKQLSRFTPHAWALDAYAQLLLTKNPNLPLVAQACGVLAAFGGGFSLVAWYVLKLD
jgi:hypothetical protein